MALGWLRSDQGLEAKLQLMNTGDAVAIQKSSLTSENKKSTSIPPGVHSSGASADSNGVSSVSRQRCINNVYFACGWMIVVGGNGSVATVHEIQYASGR